MKLHLSDKIVINVASKTALSFWIGQSIPTAGFLDGGGSVLDISAGVDKLRKAFSFLFGKCESLSRGLIYELAERQITIASGIFVIGSADPCTGAFATRWSIAEIATWTQALPMRLALHGQRIAFSNLAQIKRHRWLPQLVVRKTYGKQGEK